MSHPTARRIILGYPKDQDGKHVCRWCRGPVPTGRRTWCSNKCVDEYRARNDPIFIRRKVWERDQGICQICGLDVQALAVKLWDLYAKGRTDYEEFCAVLRSKGFTDPSFGRRHGMASGSLWQADHKVEVAAGGAELGLDNLWLVCTVCHRAKTARFAADRARARRVARQSEFALPSV